MLLENYYYYYPGSLGNRFCDMVIDYALSKKEEEAITSDENKSISNYTRQSNLVWLEDKWIYRQIHSYLHDANAGANWNYQWDQTEAVQFTIYKPGQYYDWHCDMAKKANDKGKIRKISAVINISDPKDYTGGELEFDFRDGSPPLICEEIKPRGSIVVFPGFLYHRVKPVIDGTRYSLVCWAQGNSWR
jgi:PKHD-type hydroxylase